jgi:hypothetical protein
MSGGILSGAMKSLKALLTCAAMVATALVVTSVVVTAVVVTIIPNAEAIAGARASATATAPGADAVTHPTAPYADESFGYGKGRQPVISIQHHAAMEYCRWLFGEDRPRVSTADGSRIRGAPGLGRRLLIRRRSRESCGPVNRVKEKACDQPH